LAWNWPKDMTLIAVPVGAAADEGLAAEPALPVVGALPDPEGLELPQAATDAASSPAAASAVPARTAPWVGVEVLFFNVVSPCICLMLV